MSTTSNSWDINFLKDMSGKGDPYAEQLIEETAKGGDFKSLHLLFTTMKNDADGISQSGLPATVIEYFNHETVLPEWADQKKIKLAQNVYSRFGPQIALLLNFKALPLCYACRNGARVLASTGRLTGSGKDVSKTMRRLFETSQMVMNVLSPEGFSPIGKGIITVKKVRLYHAAIRYFLMHPKYNPELWNTQRDGLPINQEEMAGTLMAFSALVLKGLEQLGANLKSEEKDAYIHCWNIVGHFLGVDPKLYPKTFEEGWNLGISIINRNKEACEQGKLLTSSLLDFSHSFFSGSFIDRWLLNSLPVFLIQFFVADVGSVVKTDLATLLGAGKTQNFFQKWKGRVFLSIIGWVTKKENRKGLLRALSVRYSNKFLEGMVRKYLETYQVAFYIPDSLKASWQMTIK